MYSYFYYANINEYYIYASFDNKQVLEKFRYFFCYLKSIIFMIQGNVAKICEIVQAFSWFCLHEVSGFLKNRAI